MTPKSIPNLALDLFVDFLHTLFLLPRAMFLIVCTVPTCSKNTQKTAQKQSLENTMKKHDDFCKKQEIFRKRLPNGVPKSESKLGKCRFGASGGTSGVSARFFTQKK